MVVLTPLPPSGSTTCLNHGEPSQKCASFLRASFPQPLKPLKQTSAAWGIARFEPRQNAVRKSLLRHSLHQGTRPTTYYHEAWPCPFHSLGASSGVRASASRGSGGRGFGNSPGQSRDTEKALRATVELDRLIDTLRRADSGELPQIIAENIFSFDQTFWLRLATRADSCSSAQDRVELEELSRTVMGIVERLVRCTEERMDSSSDKLAELLAAAAVVDGANAGEEILWPPKDPSTVQRLRQELKSRAEAGELDEGFLGGVTAQLRQAVERGDRPGLVAMLQKVLQLYAGLWFAKRSYAKKDDGEEDEAERLLESIIYGEVEDWDAELRQGLALGGGQVSEEDFFRVLELRAKRMQMRTESGSYEQRILGEYLAELEARAQSTVAAFRSSAPV